MSGVRNSAARLIIDYSYLNHAQAAFDAAGATVLTLDFGTIVKGSAAQTRLFSLNNIGGINTAALDLDSIVQGGSNSFLSNLSTFAAEIGGGGTRGYQLAFDPTTVGLHNGSYTLNLSDADVGAGMRNSVLTINTIANVIDNVAAVPEPASWALMLGGSGFAGTAVRRRRRAVPSAYA